MIKIKLSKEDMEHIEKEHWKWFEMHYENSFFIEKVGMEKKFSYKKCSKETEKVKIDNPEVIRFLSYITNSGSKVLKTIVVGKLINEEDKEKSIRYITEHILKEFPEIFNKPIKKSVNSFLENKRKMFIGLKGDDRNDDSHKFIKIKDSMKKYFEINKEILQVYINDLDNIDSKIEKIKLTRVKICKFSDKEFIDFKYNDIEIFDEVEKILSCIFNYKLFTNEGKENSSEWGAYNLLNKLNITTCPYCNRNYIHTYIGKDGMCRADIDHFYPKSKYPFLAVSLYNFIPSCHVCNSSFKNSIDTFLLPHIYPYDDEFGDYAKFKTEPSAEADPLEYLLGNSTDFTITLDINNSLIKDKVENSNNTFKIEGMYSFHKDYIQEIIKKARIYNESRINELLVEYSDLFSSKEELLRTIFSNYLSEEEFGNRPLSKFSKDICDEFNIQTY